jgi:hypothetical protein
MREIRTLGPVLVAALASPLLAQSPSVTVELDGILIDFPEPARRHPRHA